MRALRCWSISLLLLFACTKIFAGAETAVVVGDMLSRFRNGPLPAAKVEEIGKTVVGEGVGAIPVLIDHLGDGTVAVLRAAPPLGECYNRPINSPAPPYCSVPQAEKTALGKLCEEWLYRIVTPAYSSPLAKGRGRGKAGMMRPLEIKDWRIWWERHKEMSLHQLHDEARLLIDEYWRRGWEKGPVEWK